ncbi:MAG: DUF429 domain-containing protein, partial [Alphaproteobacteria bacterium]|nr:DUF429 domain-containing protein [Alphaproteobacteria bacterium]
MLATSVPSRDGLATLLVTPDEVHSIVAPKLDKVPNGTGDFLSGLYLAERLEHAPQQAFAAAMKTLSRAIVLSTGITVLNVAGALHHTGELNPQETPSRRSDMPPDSEARYVGLDGCRAGWLAVYWDGIPTSSPHVRLLKAIGDLDLSGVSAGAIDIPIGFMDTVTQGGREAEREARAFLKGKAS